MFGAGNRGLQLLGGKSVLRDRLKAWWEGYDLVEKPQHRALDLGLDHDVRYEREREYWETSRLELVQRVWGEGFSSPGGADYIMNMVNFFGLDPAHSVLDLGAGLGGAARTMCENLGVWVTGLEPDADLVEAATALSVKAGMGKKVTIEQFDPDTFNMKAKSIDCVFSKEFLFSVKHKREFLEMVEILLKAKGQFLFTDYVYTQRHMPSGDIKVWIDNEPMGAHPWAMQDYQDVFAELHLDIRVTEDITDSFRSLVTQSWADYIDSLQRKGISPGMAPALVDEVEIWSRRIQAIETGDLRIMRFHVIKKDTEALMSDW
jgi:cyclopropane fatty-acyl-phospholipid synthase-like methyltransferase